MYQFIGATVDELFLGALHTVISDGAIVSPRGIETREIFPAAFELRNPRARVLLVEGRYINPAFAIAETLWILSGSQDPWIFDYNSRLKQFANDGVLRGAYGPRIRSWGGQMDQLEQALSTLRRDHATRRAIIQLYDPMSVGDNHLDIPCTITHHFLIRDERLHLFTTMRGQDVWLGLPYDVFYNTLLQELMAGWVGVELGSYYYRADSLHVYEHDMSAAQSIAKRNQDREPSMAPIQMDWETRDVQLAAVLSGRIPPDHSFASLAKILDSYRKWTSGSHSSAIDIADSLEGPLGEATRRWYGHLSSRISRSSGVA